jgi:aminoglycoside phosphotransferase family enzyme/predicted kinase
LVPEIGAMAEEPGGAASEPQAEVIAFLGDGASFGLPGVAVDRITTHAAVVFLVGERAYKMKRAVRYSFLDFTTLERRTRALEAELELNRRTAPMLYRRLVAVTRAADGRLALAGSGEPLEWLLEMTRFDQAARLDRVAERGQLTPELIDDLAAEVADFHDRAAPRPGSGGHAGMRAVIEGNAVDLATIPPAVLPGDWAERLTLRCRAELARRRRLLEQRRRSGRVRRCHGDLHLGNIVLLDRRPVLFDCLEFDEALAAIDTLYDLAFLLMDLEHQGLGALAQRLLSGYLEAACDDGGVALLPLFLACRAAIRAKVLGLGAAQGGGGDPGPAVAEARAYLEAALGYLDPPPPRLVAIGGLSGTGKSSLARRLAPTLGPAPGAVILRSDVARKRRFGVAPQDRLPPAAYRKETSRAVYDTLAARAGTLLRAGHAALVDAVFLDPKEREQIEAVAAAAGVAFLGLWLSAPEDVLVQRVALRRGDASDATPAVVRGQLAIDPGRLRWRTLEASGPPEGVADAARSLLALGDKGLG